MDGDTIGNLLQPELVELIRQRYFKFQSTP
jgi:hypothetical protein